MYAGTFDYQDLEGLVGRKTTPCSLRAFPPVSNEYIVEPQIALANRRIVWPKIKDAFEKNIERLIAFTSS